MSSIMTENKNCVFCGDKRLVAMGDHTCICADCALLALAVLGKRVMPVDELPDFPDLIRATPKTFGKTTIGKYVLAIESLKQKYGG